MKIRNLKTKLIAPILFLLPMACMHLGDGHQGDGHHTGSHLSSIPQQPCENSIPNEVAGSMTEETMAGISGIMEDEGTKASQESPGEK